jgi:hypothetical protein
VGLEMDMEVSRSSTLQAVIAAILWLVISQRLDPLSLLRGIPKSREHSALAMPLLHSPCQVSLALWHGCQTA